MLTLYPGGAFMMCESLSDFDPNVPLPVDEGAVADAAKAAGSSLKSYAASAARNKTVQAVAAATGSGLAGFAAGAATATAIKATNAAADAGVNKAISDYKRNNWRKNTYGDPNVHVKSYKGELKKELKNQFGVGRGAPTGQVKLTESIGDIPMQPVDPEHTFAVPVQQPSVPDPVMELCIKMGRVFENDVKPIMMIDYGGLTDSQDAVQKLELLRNKMSKLCDIMRLSATQMEAYIRMLRSPATTSCSTFSSHIGLYMKNASRIRELGYSEYHYDYCSLRAFTESWRIERILNAVVNNPAVLDDIITREYITALAGSSNSSLATCFNSLTDMIVCMYNGHDRRLRLESHEHRTMSFDDMVEDSVDTSRCDSADLDRGFVTSFNKLISATLRRTMMESYDQLCLIMDAEYNQTNFCRVYKKLCYRFVNLFAMCTMLLFSFGYQSREVIARLQAMDAYDTLLMDKLGLNPSTPSPNVSVTGAPGDYPSPDIE